MKKIDLHIHTKATISDASFSFSLDTLKRYVEKCELDCIAITNHNMFDYQQYEIIKENLDIVVFPGIEINLEDGHLLLISKSENLIDFNLRCSRVTELILSKEDSITIDQLIEIYGCLNNYLLIPHYDKKPSCSEKVLYNLSTYINAGEVNSIKKFLYCQKDLKALTPVYFSDSRITQESKSFSIRQTFLDIDEISIESIKLCLKDKTKVFLSYEEGHKVFQILENGLKVSTGLTVILGERSSGKSFTLDQIYKSYENVKYIKQFSLLETDESKDVRKFDSLLALKQSTISEEYLREFKIVVDDISDVELYSDISHIDNYIRTLLKNASEVQRDDAFSKAKLFNEIDFEEDNLDNLKKVIDAAQTLLENLEYRVIIEKHVSQESLLKLTIELMQMYRTNYEENLKKRFINEIIHEVKRSLQLKTATTVIEDVDFYKVLINIEKVRAFNNIVKLIKKDRLIMQKDVNGFKIVANSLNFSGANELRTVCGKQCSLSNAFAKYERPYEYLQELKSVDVISKSDYYKYFINIQFRILNKYGFGVSGGERSEFNLLNEINDALQYDMLLLDEPESSFDNLFLKNSVNDTIKNLSKHIPVIVVTHNNTVGASIKPDFLVYTKKDIIDGKIAYKVYSGYPYNKTLISLEGESMSNHDMLLNCLEAGESAYEERGKNYEMLEN